MDASWTNVLAEALDQPETLDDSEIDDRRDKFMDGSVPPCDPPAIYTQVLQNSYNDMYTIFTFTGICFAFKINQSGCGLYESMKEK